ncbi:MAG: glycosyltransferase family 4 protein [Bacteroidia bacterium]
MKILFDDEIFFRQRYGGVSKIFSLLLQNLSNDKDFDILFKNFYSENEYLIGLNLNGVEPVLKNKNFPLKGKIIRAIGAYYGHAFVNKILKQQKADIFHPTFYSNYFFKSLSNKTKLVITIHDLIHEKFSSNQHYRNLAKIKMQNIKQADAIVTVSENTKKDLLEIYPFTNPNKIYVNYLAEDISGITAKPIKNLPEKYILFTGERRGYKNFNVLVKAFAIVAKKHADLFLFCTGSLPFTADEIKMFKNLNIENKVIQQSLSIGELKYAYNSAKVFIFPSKYEGFGIPVLEAFACKVALIISNCGSLPEIAGDACLKFNADDELELSHQIINVLEDKNLSNSLIEKGTERLKLFSWQKHIQQTKNLYLSLV